jgi:hypothetical protein
MTGAVFLFDFFVFPEHAGLQQAWNFSGQRLFPHDDSESV